VKNEIIKSIYKCPVCQGRLIRDEKRYTCSNNHSYDISEKGYVNLLLANQKKTKDPGDNRDMIKSRRDFLNKEYYKRFSDCLNEVIIEELHSDERNILDAGCGEGYYISNLRSSFLKEDNQSINANFYGTDISKNAIMFAAKRDKNINISVASSFDLPIINNSLDCVIRNFAPGDNREFYRVLKGDGILIIATPSVEHLFGLKEILYENPRKNEIKENNPEDFKHIRNKEIRYTISLDNPEDITNLISMTPYYWSITDSMRGRIGEIMELETELDFNIDVYKKI
jgi:23S rRNA (guanine745-N1)-methyltransferase